MLQHSYSSMPQPLVAAMPWSAPQDVVEQLYEHPQFEFEAIFIANVDLLRGDLLPHEFETLFAKLLAMTKAVRPTWKMLHNLVCILTVYLPLIHLIALH